MQGADRTEGQHDVLPAAPPVIGDIVLHGTCVAMAGRALLITGASGSGKSAMGLALMAFGCTLIADDRTVLTRSDGVLTATCPAPILGLIEARGIGLLAAVAGPPTPLHLCVDLDRTEPDRLPPRRSVTYLGCAVPLILATGHRHFEAAVLQYLVAGRRH